MPLNFGRKSRGGGSSGGSGGGSGGGSITDTTLYKGAFDTDTDYSVGDIVEHDSKFWIAISVVDHSVGDYLPGTAQGSEWLQLDSNVFWRGEWSDDSVAYRLGDIVEHDDIAYMVLAYHSKDLSLIHI